MVTVLHDSTAAHEASVVLALPVDPATLREPDGSAPGGAANDTLARLRALGDTVTIVDAQFQDERDALNAEARAMRALDRWAPSYARRFDAFRLRAIAAESLRARRDRMQRREGAQRERLAHLLPSAAEQRNAQGRHREKLLSAGDGSRITRSAPMSSSATSLSLPPGRWWLGLAPAGGIPATYRALTVSAGSRDTLRLTSK